jgi:NDP-sugar pyrophosphorylase family protein
VAYLYNGYWIDIGTPEKYLQVHRDIMDGRFSAAPFADLPEPRMSIAPDARIEGGARVEGPCFIDEGTLIKAGARVGPYSVIGRQTQIDEDANIEGAIIWPNCRIGGSASVQDAVLGRNCHVGRNVSVNGGAILGDKTTLTDFTRA